MVFTLNTTVFAEEVAVDSVDDAVEATVDAVDEVAEEATVDDATTDATTTGYVGHLKYTTTDGKSVINAEITYSADPNVKKNAKENVVKITGVDDCVSWANVFKTDDGYDYYNPANPDWENSGFGGPALIATVLTGSSDDTTNLVNNTELKVSSNGAEVGETGFYAGYEGYTEKVGNKLHGKNFGAYRVIDLGDDSHYLFVGYGSNGSDIQGEEGLIPVYEYDGRQIAFDKTGNRKYSTSKAEKLDVAAALVEYKDGTVTEIPGVEVSSVKFAKKTGKDATVSGQMNEENWSYETWDTIEKKVKTVDKKTVAGKEVDLTRDAYKKNADLATFTISVKVKGKDIDKTVKKAITDKLKNETFKVAIRQKVVNAWLDATTSELFEDLDADKNDTGIVKVSGNKAASMTDDLFNNTEEFDKFDFDDFNISKYNQEKGKATVAMYVGVGDKKKGYKDATIALKAGTDYDLSDGSLAQTVKFIDFKGNFVYADSSTEDDDLVSEDLYGAEIRNVAPNGYKWAFRQTPSTDGKKTKTFRYGVFKGTQDGFVYSVDETAVDSVEEAF